MLSRNNVENAPKEGKIVSDGLEIGYLDWELNGEDRKNLLVIHPNGFCAGMFDPMVHLISDHYRVIGVDLRGHGASEEVIDENLLGKLEEISIIDGNQNTLFGVRKDQNKKVFAA